MIERSQLIPQLAREVARLPEASDRHTRMCLAMCRVLGTDGGSMTIDNLSPNRQTLCVTDEVAALLESAQDVVGEGPCVHAFLNNATVVADFDHVERTWPNFAARVRPVAVEKLIALPIHAGEAVLGVVSMYQRRSASLACELADAEFLVDVVSASIIDIAATQFELHGLESWPKRREVHQATGMIVAQLAISDVDALAILRAHAYATDSDLAAVSHEVLSRRLVFSSSQAGHVQSDQDEEKDG
jgi:hypothetical protein